jgi:hypothetical protein
MNGRRGGVQLEFGNKSFAAFPLVSWWVLVDSCERRWRCYCQERSHANSYVVGALMTEKTTGLEVTMLWVRYARSTSQDVNAMQDNPPSMLFQDFF